MTKARSFWASVVAPLARAIIGGLSASVVLTVLIVPAAYLVFYRNRPLPAGAAELVFQVISERNERSSMIVTTNLPFGEWTKVFPDARLAKAVVDRLTHRAHIIDTGTVVGTVTLHGETIPVDCPDANVCSGSQ